MALVTIRRTPSVQTPRKTYTHVYHQNATIVAERVPDRLVFLLYGFYIYAGSTRGALGREGSRDVGSGAALIVPARVLCPWSPRRAVRVANKPHPPGKSRPQIRCLYECLRRGNAPPRRLSLGLHLMSLCITWSPSGNDGINVSATQF
ncbi:hypothetical protein RR48_14547 [Papilio machaon]|uniref:Uncharacterized protein n=1 Tax=Papilio machaon TaxID=76193 RepID=A0A194QMC5_PAPMA|nr:hypothetical protein RR48_14547 [Papilio machaon]